MCSLGISKSYVMKKLLLSFVLAFFSISSFASHIHGGQIYWEALGNDQYIIHLELFGDSSAVVLPTNPSVQVGSSMNVTLTQSNRKLLFCSGSPNNWFLYHYESQLVTIQVSASTNVDFIFYTCCLPTTANITGQPALYIKSTMYASGYNKSSSYYDLESFFVSDYTLPVLSTNTGIDSSHVDIVPAPISATATATYSTGYTYDKPYSSGDVFTGSHFILGSGTGTNRYLFAFKQQNFGLSGALTSEVGCVVDRMVNNPTNLSSATNSSPSLMASQGASWTTSDSLQYSTSASPGDTVSLRVMSSDMDFLPNFSPQTITAELGQSSSTNASLIPVSPQAGLASTVNNTVDFRWVVPANAAGQYSFNVRMRDDHCPTNGMRAIQLRVNVNNPNVVVSNVVICQGASILLNAPISGTTYEWSPNIGLSATNTATVTATPSSTVAYTVKVDGNVAGVYTVSPTQQITPIASQPQPNQIQLDNPGDFTQHAFLYYYVPFAIDDTLVTINQSGIYHIAARNGFCYDISQGISVLPDTANGVYLISSPLNDPNNTVLDDQSSYEMDITVGAADAALKIYEVIIPGAELSQKMGGVSLKLTDYTGAVTTVPGVDAGVGIKFNFPVGVFMIPNGGSLELVVDSGAVEIPMVPNITYPYHPNTTGMYLEVTNVTGMANGQPITDMVPFVFRGSMKVSIEEVHQNSLNVYPQPADEYIIVEGALQADYSVIDMNGRVLLQGQMAEERIDISELNTGVYILTVQNEKGIYTSRISVR